MPKSFKTLIVLRTSSDSSRLVISDFPVESDENNKTLCDIDLSPTTFKDPNNLFIFCF